MRWHRLFKGIQAVVFLYRNWNRLDPAVRQSVYAEMVRILNENRMKNK